MGGLLAQSKGLRDHRASVPAGLREGASGPGTGWVLSSTLFHSWCGSQAQADENRKDTRGSMGGCGTCGVLVSFHAPEGSETR